MAPIVGMHFIFYGDQRLRAFLLPTRPLAEKGHQGHSHSDLCLSCAKMKRALRLEIGLSGERDRFPGSPFEFLLVQSSREKETQGSSKCVSDTSPPLQREISATKQLFLRRFQV